MLHYLHRHMWYMIIRGEHICGGGEPRSDCTCRVWVLLLVLLLPHCIIAHFLETTVRVGRKLQLPFNGSCQEFGLENNSLAPALFLNNQLMPCSIIRFDEEKQSEWLETHICQVCRSKTLVLVLDTSLLGNHRDLCLMRIPNRRWPSLECR